MLMAGGEAGSGGSCAPARSGLREGAERSILVSATSAEGEATREEEAAGGDGKGGQAPGTGGGDGGGDSNPPPEELPLGAEARREAAVATAQAAIDGTLGWG